MKRPSARGMETRLRIIRTAADLFHKQGVRATSPDDIIEASRTGKGQFYHYFKGKEDLIHEVLQVYLKEIESNTAPLSYEISSWDDMEQWFRANIELQKGFQMTRGCPFGTIGNEVTSGDELIRQDLSLIFEVMKSRIVAFLVREKAAGRLVEDAREQAIADYCIALIQGAMLMGKIKRNADVAEAAIGEAMAHLRRYSALASPMPARPRRSSP